MIINSTKTFRFEISPTTTATMKKNIIISRKVWSWSVHAKNRTIDATHTRSLEPHTHTRCLCTIENSIVFFFAIAAARGFNKMFVVRQNTKSRASLGGFLSSSLLSFVFFFASSTRHAELYTFWNVVRRSIDKHTPVVSSSTAHASHTHKHYTDVVSEMRDYQNLAVIFRRTYAAASREHQNRNPAALAVLGVLFSLRDRRTDRRVDWFWCTGHMGIGPAGDSHVESLAHTIFVIIHFNVTLARLFFARFCLTLLMCLWTRMRWCGGAGTIADSRGISCVRNKIGHYEAFRISSLVPVFMFAHGATVQQTAGSRSLQRCGVEGESGKKQTKGSFFLFNFNITIYIHILSAFFNTSLFSNDNSIIHI